MKAFYYIVLMVFITTCSAQNSPVQIELKYKAITRGSFIEVNCNLESLTYKSTTDKKEIQFNESQVKTFKSLIGEIQVGELESLKAPSTKSYSDAALQATFKLVVDGKISTAPTFDHGNPPQELKALLDWVFQLIAKE